jgi:hypothetical protein
MKLSRLILITIGSFLFFSLFATCQRSEAFEGKGVLIAQDDPSDGMILMDGHLVRGSYRNGYFYEDYYLHTPKKEKSPYENLHVKSAGELQVTVKPIQAKVLVDGYALNSWQDQSYTIGLLTGKHMVDASADGYKPYHKEIDVQQGQRVLVSIEFKK